MQAAVIDTNAIASTVAPTVDNHDSADLSEYQSAADMAILDASRSAKATDKIAAAVKKVIEGSKIVTAMYDQLFLSQYNVRPNPTNVEPREWVAELGALIAHHGLLQNLVGFEEMDENGKPTGRIGVVAGKRRYYAIGFNIEDGLLPEEFGININIVSESEAIAVSLAENQGRVEQHHADTCAAMLKLHALGASVEDIAMTFGVDEVRVRRRLKLANVSPTLFELYRQDKLNYDQMAAFAISDDHGQQEAVYKQLGPRPWVPDIKKMLTKAKIPAASSIGVFVADAYKAAGGAIDGDLFSEEKFLADPELARTLALQKMAVVGNKLKGCAWIETKLNFPHSEREAYVEPRVAYRDATPEESAELKAIDAEYDQLEIQLAEMEDADQEDTKEYKAAEKKSSELDKRRDKIKADFRSVVPEDKALAGAVVYLNHNKIEVMKNVIRPSDKAKMVKLKTGATKKPDDTGAKQKSVHSDALTHNLTTHRTLGLRAELMLQPAVAIMVATAAMVARVFDTELKLRHADSPISTLRIESVMLDDDAQQGAAGAAINEQRQKLAALLPKVATNAALLQWMMEQSQELVWELFSFCTAHSIDATLPRETTKTEKFTVLGKAVKLDMTKWWTPDDKTYFGRVSKDRMIEVVGGVSTPAHAAPLDKMKKAQAAEAATLAVKGTGWLPEMLRTV